MSNFKFNLYKISITNVIEKLEVRIEELEYKDNIVGEVYCQQIIGLKPFWSWQDFIKDNILEELNGYVKIQIPRALYDIIGIKKGGQKPSPG